MTGNVRFAVSCPQRVAHRADQRIVIRHVTGRRRRVTASPNPRSMLCELEKRGDGTDAGYEHDAGITLTVH
jgi:hypothetical protein